jgi:hypothetical protein
MACPNAPPGGAYSPNDVEKPSDKSLDGSQGLVLVALKVAKMVLLGQFFPLVGAPSDMVPQSSDSF